MAKDSCCPEERLRFREGSGLLASPLECLGVASPQFGNWSGDRGEVCDKPLVKIGTVEE